MIRGDVKEPVSGRFDHLASEVKTTHLTQAFVKFPNTLNKERRTLTQL